VALVSRCTATAAAARPRLLPLHPATDLPRTHNLPYPQDEDFTKPIVTVAVPCASLSPPPVAHRFRVAHSSTRVALTDLWCGASVPHADSNALECNNTLLDLARVVVEEVEKAGGIGGWLSIGSHNC
jgi:hypothetical protein